LRSLRAAAAGSSTAPGSAAAGAASSPARLPTLVVNGNPLPLYTDAEGRFARP
jgi:uncharacterized protein YfaP (DUF2135 family)